MMNQLWLPKTRARIVYLFTQLKLPTKYYKKYCFSFFCLFPQSYAGKKIAQISLQTTWKSETLLIKVFTSSYSWKKNALRGIRHTGLLTHKNYSNERCGSVHFLGLEIPSKRLLYWPNFLFSRWENLNGFKDQIICFRLGFSRIL